MYATDTSATAMTTAEAAAEAAAPTSAAKMTPANLQHLRNSSSYSLPAAITLAYVAFTVILNLLGRYHRAGPSTYSASVLVLIVEVLKLAVCTIQSLRQVGAAELRAAVFERDTLSYALPSIMYAIQKNLDFASMARLEIPIYLLVIEGKSVLTAVWTCALLGRRFSRMQLVALALLVFGDALAIGAFDPGAIHTSGPPPASDSTNNSTLRVRVHHHVRGPQHHQAVLQAAATAADSSEGRRYLIGVVCGLLGVFLSSLASVYSELLLKRPGDLWVRNVQFGVFGAPFALAILGLSGDLQWIASNGALHGFGPGVWLLAVLVALFGLIMAACLKYVSAVAIGFARAVGIVVLSILSIPLFHFEPSASFLVGAPIVVGAMGLYAVGSAACAGQRGKAHGEERLEAASLLCVTGGDETAEKCSAVDRPPQIQFVAAAARSLR